MLELDGSDGGGQLFRSALTLSALTTTDFEMGDIRGSRPEPGLNLQHLTALQTVADITNASVEGAKIGSSTVSFEPEEPMGGHYEAAIGTAGSVTLLFDAVLPLASALDRPLTLTATGGTSVKWSPSMPWYRRVNLPLLRRSGLLAAIDVERPGFYPAGGGQARLSLAPSPLSKLSLRDPGEPERALVHSTATADLADSDVAERQSKQARDRLAAASIDVEVTERATRYVSADSTGTIALLVLAYDNGVIGADALGEPGKPAEDVADEAVDAALTAHETGAAVDEHLADQLIPWLATVGGEVRISRVTDHVGTHVDLFDAFGFDVRIEQIDDGPILVSDA
ncbi:RNA 3'-terminal phosphate cyclase protein [Halorhabdus tiamatea SARL4B]|uniref:RNA 3'-terminal phosphate cyclase n=1 Tax=Halorhabdus tiamatea SARL4B TaxID=1033806 RepID=F7PL68_9EURY|nr:RNA 3'-terminal phosphate cyclase [Halorhabdus tiamatea]ERJ05879.1 RNA 3'-terminal phosphate cyclase protein [Halorhabdus tiamatea SARL4B]CCQ34442.1 RNA 3'-terminal phosphate cyclase [Halorhabdus tiamatea SARL4B]